MNEFKDQIDAAEKEKVEKLIIELRELAVKGQSGDASVDADKIREKINETQQASLGLFQKVYEKRAEESKSSSTESETPSEEKKEEKKEEEKVRISSSSFDISGFCAHYFFTFTGGIRRRHGLRSLRLNALKPPLPFPIPITHPVIVCNMMAPSYCYRVVLKSCVICLP